MFILGICTDLVLLHGCALVHAAKFRNGVCESASSPMLSAIRVICAHCIEVASYPHQLRIPIQLPHVVDHVVIHGVEDGLILHDKPVLIRMEYIPMRGLRVTGDVRFLRLEEELLILASVLVLVA